MGAGQERGGKGDGWSRHARDGASEEQAVCASSGSRVTVPLGPSGVGAEKQAGKGKPAGLRFRTPGLSIELRPTGPHGPAVRQLRETYLGC